MRTTAVTTKETGDMTEEPPKRYGARAPGLFTAIDAWFFGAISLVVVSGAFLPFLPFLLAGLAVATPLRRSRWRLITVLLMGLLLGLLFTAPFLLDPFDLEFIEQGPVQTAH